MKNAWARWLLQERFGSDPEVERFWLTGLARIRDRILRRANVEEGAVILDAGCGDGLLGFGALVKAGPNGKVIFSDESAELVEHCREVTGREGVSDRCEFVAADVRKLEPIAGNSIDIIVSRAVLMYLRDRESAFKAFHRVLKPGGRVSICEPLQRIGYTGQPDLLRGSDFSAVADLQQRIDAHYLREYPDDPTRDFDADDLLNMAEAAGFASVEVLREAYSMPTPPRHWNAVLKTPPFAGLSPLGRVLETFSATDQERFERHIRPQVEAGGVGRMRAADAYLIARK
ncbi:MAG: methyltransferase domain-containing protein [Candidatus Binataceae bacterium]